MAGGEGSGGLDSWKKCGLAGQSEIWRRSAEILFSAHADSREIVASGVSAGGVQSPRMAFGSRPAARRAAADGAFPPAKAHARRGQ